MRFWETLKQIVGLAETVAPALPIPDRAKRAVAQVGQTERAVEAVVRAAKPKPKVKPKP